MKLKDKTIIVTGAAGGLGRAFSLRFAEEGANVVCADVKDAAETVALITDAGGSALSVSVDITGAASVEAMCKAAADAYGGIDGLVNNAAIYAGLTMEPFHEIKESDWDKVMAVNAKGTWLCCKYVYPYLIKRGGGSIVNIASASILEGNPFFAHYTASKGAVWALTRSVSRVVGEQGIRCNSITPGYTMTDASKGLAGDPESFQKNYDYSIQTRAIHRAMEAGDVVGAALFLLSDDSAFVTGQNLNVDGGCINY
ncbi:MAG: SDR family oxidoreductase [Clostridiales Family XIII bacterium]|jgi:3-oxoacyl-[acyl-carrier protein] reductase|nr:SDR family oxidoreductase [Clostridiales Family XIII bacterium]